ncbi:ATP-binding protein, partial [Pantoea ananatis]|nr:ATP-binding protein [Pantoea ananatis]
TERASTGRERNGLPGIISADSLADDVGAAVEPEDGNLLTFLNQQLGVAGTQSPESGDWADVVAAGIEEAGVARERRAEERRIHEEELETYKASPEYLQLIKDQAEYFGASEQEEREFMASSRLRLLESLPGATPENLTQEILEYLVYLTDTDEEELDAWQRKTWEQPGGYRPLPAADDSASAVQKPETRPKDSLPESWLPYVNEGETRGTIERNAAAAGFIWELDYLEWRHSNETDIQE